MYHLLFLVALNIAATKIQNKATQVSVFILNALSLLVFLLGFSWLPVSELSENLLTPESNHIGFIFHYASILAAIFIVFKMYKAIHQNGSFIKNTPVLNTTLLSTAIIYLTSVELVLHVLKLNLINVFNSNTDYEYFNKLSEISTVETHTVKIGFPILWGVLAFIFLFIGMKRSNKTFRIISLLLIALILLKLFTYDIKDASEAGKIIAFIILGVVLLIISFMYQKIKALLLDDANDKKETSEPLSNSDPESKKD